jgi:hypothetical protein
MARVIVRLRLAGRMIVITWMILFKHRFVMMSVFVVFAAHQSPVQLDRWIVAQNADAAMSVENAISSPLRTVRIFKKK